MLNSEEIMVTLCSVLLGSSIYFDSSVLLFEDSELDLNSCKRVVTLLTTGSLTISPVKCS